jgi:sodium-dependent dicarboxylate transporter 2/3/5
MSACLPLAVTSLLPIALFPLMDIMGTNEACSQYFKSSNFVFFCGVSLALGAEKSNLHRRVALRILLLVGTDPKWFIYRKLCISTM